MRVFRSECPPDYGTYTFSYAEYAELEEGDNLSTLYEAGFLPYTGNTTIAEELFYLCRSVRVHVKYYEVSSENRRVDRKAAPLGITMECFEKPDFGDLKDEVHVMVDRYSAQRFQNGKMDEGRFEFVYGRKAATHCFRFFSPDGDLKGFVLAGIDHLSVHFWFSFFDTSLMASFPMGKWMMWKVIEWSVENGRKFVYLGTCYGEKPLYKIRDFKGIEFFDGNRWNHNAHLLKKYCRLDDRSERTDLFKLNL